MEYITYIFYRNLMLITGVHTVKSVLCDLPRKQ